MAKIEGIEPGLMPVEVPASKEKAIPQPKGHKPPCLCCHCGGEMTPRDQKAWNAQACDSDQADDDDELQSYCRACSNFFGLDYMRGITNCAPDKAKERVDQAAEYGWVMIMCRGTFTAPGGTTFEVEPGDCFRVSRAGVKDLKPICHRDYVAQRFSVECQVGPIVLKQWPHEFTPVTQVYLMSLVADGELEVKYLATNDETGYYTPTPALREQLNHMFG